MPKTTKLNLVVITLDEARRNRRRKQTRKANVDSPLKAFRAAVWNLNLSQREYRACLNRIKISSEPNAEVTELLSRFGSRPSPETELGAALARLEDCRQLRKRGQRRQDAIRRVIHDANHKGFDAEACAERIINGDHWLGMTWLAEVKDGRIMAKAQRREYIPGSISMAAPLAHLAPEGRLDAWPDIPRPGIRLRRADVQPDSQAPNIPPQFDRRLERPCGAEPGRSSMAVSSTMAA